MVLYLAQAANLLFNYMLCFNDTYFVVPFITKAISGGQTLNYTRIFFGGGVGSGGFTVRKDR